MWTDLSGAFGYGTKLTSAQQGQLRDNAVLLYAFLASCNLADHGILLGSATGAITPTAVMTDGQMLVGQSGADPLPKTMSGDGTLSAAGALTVSSTGAATVTQASLKTSLSEFNNNAETGASGWELMAGGEYGFSVQGKGDDTNMQFAYGMTIGTLGADGDMISASFVGPMIQWTWVRTDSSASHYLYLQQRYVTSSGEINWFFMRRDPVTKKISHRWFAPDHPCFGNGGKPEDVPHPWIFNRDIDGEIVVIQITPEEMEVMRADHPEYESTLEMLTHCYEIDEGSTPKWSTKEITVGLPKGREWKNEKAGTKVTPIKKVIPKPDNVIHRSLKKKEATK